MNRGQGLVLGVIVAAGLLLRPTGFPPPQQGESSKGNTNVLTAQGPTEAGEDGPWTASCSYWASMRTPTAEDRSSKTPSEFHDTLNATDGGFDLHLQLNGTNQERKLACGSEVGARWGFPDNDLHRVDVTSIIATVPDPVHGHMALAFDRVVDALLDAATDSHFVSSYYWLPWKGRIGALKAAGSEGNAELSHDPGRERKPGLIILRHVPRKIDPNDPLDEAQPDLENSCYRVIYVFLVAETPVLGVDGFQLQNAFFYEAELERAVVARHGWFSRGRNGAVAIVGPEYSGSAAPLRAGIEQAYDDENDKLTGKPFELAGTTATELSVDLLTPTPQQNKEREEEGKANPQVRYLSFETNSKYDEDIFKARLRAAGYDLGRATSLIEDNTTVGVSIQREVGEARQDPMRVIRFPRNISLLRNAQAAEVQYANEAVPSASIRSPYLRFSLKEPFAEDSVPQFSQEHTPLSQEAQLMTIARQLHRDRSEFIAIDGEVLDQVFLAQFLHRACPDARLVFFGSDVFMVREIENVPFIGSLTITPYPLLGLGRGYGVDERSYAASDIEAYYNAVIYTLWDPLEIFEVKRGGPAAKAGLKKGDVITFLDKSPITDRDALDKGISSLTKGRSVEVLFRRSGEPQEATVKPGDPDRSGDRFGAVFALPRLQGYRSPLNSQSEISSPALWATAIGSDGYYPLAILSRRVSDAPSILPAIPLARSTTLNFTVYPARLWLVLCVAVFLLCFIHSWVLFVADYSSLVTCDLAIRDDDQPQRRSLCAHVAAAALFAMAFTVSLPAILLNLLKGVKMDWFTMAVSIVTLGAGVVALVVTVWKTWAYVGRRVWTWLSALP